MKKPVASLSGTVYTYNHAEGMAPADLDRRIQMAQTASEKARYLADIRKANGCDAETAKQIAGHVAATDHAALRAARATEMEIQTAVYQAALAEARAAGNGFKKSEKIAAAVRDADRAARAAAALAAHNASEAARKASGI
jgi:hypothetical protein